MDFMERCQVNPPDPSPVAVVTNAAGLPHDLALSDQAPHLQPANAQPGVAGSIVLR